MDPIRIVQPRDNSQSAPLQAHPWDTQSLSGGSAGSSIYDLSAVNEDRTSAIPVILRWEGGPAKVSDVRVHVRNGSTSTEVTPAGPGYAELHHLHVGDRYTVSVESVRDGTYDAVQFSTHPALPRWINVPGTTNVRDCGGWALTGDARYRQGCIYRGAELNTHLRVTQKGKRIFLEEVGIRTIIDLRGAYGGSENPTCPFSVGEAEWIHVPILPYDAIADHSQKSLYAQIFNTFSDPSYYPIYFHCWGGADRTGTVAYLLGALLGMNQEDLFTDYELTSYSVWGERTRETSFFVPLLEELSRYADTPHEQAWAYLIDAGVSEESLKSIIRNLREEQ